jgi:hypothetical protein
MVMAFIHKGCGDPHTHDTAAQARGCQDDWDHGEWEMLAEQEAERAATRFWEEGPNPQPADPRDYVDQAPF